MSFYCPVCNKPVEIVKIERSENVTVYLYSCEHKHLEIFETIGITDMLRLKVKDRSGKEVLELKITGCVEKRISRKPSKAIQIVWECERIVHLHCKAEDCGNEWKADTGAPLEDRFDIAFDEHGRTKIITCKKCGRRYFAG
jgi:uncharacterized protein YbaR (Trm112 family)